MAAISVWILTCFLWLVTGLSGALALAALDVHLDSSPGGGKSCLQCLSVQHVVIECALYCVRCSAGRVCTVRRWSVHGAEFIYERVNVP